MPVALEAGPQPPVIRPSAVTELVWLLLWLQTGPGHKLPPSLEALQPFPPELARRTETFWGDGGRVFSEALVLADAAGHLFDTDPGAFFGALAKRVPELGELVLASETASDRQMILARLRRLDSDRELRGQYVKLLRDAWALVAESWRQDALPRLEAAVPALGERFGRAGDPVEVVPKLAHAGPAVVELAREAFRAGAYVLTPCYYGGWYLVLDLPQVFLVATQVDPEWRQGNRREQLEPIAAGLRVLADPTRLAMLASLAECSLSITDLVRLLGLAQPTVSTHMRLLRDAGLVRNRREGARTEYSVVRERLEELLRPLESVVPPSA